MSNFNLGMFENSDKQIVANDHPPVIRNLAFESDVGVIPAGDVVAVDAGACVAWDGVNGTVKGIANEDIDTVQQNSGAVIVHGTAMRQHVTVSGTQITPDQELELEEKTIWLV